jgi:hypothetical protein
MNKIFSKDWFYNLDSQLRDMKLDSDDKSFDEIKNILAHPKKLSGEDFASSVAYVILAAGFSQKTAKKYHRIIMDKIQENQCMEDLLKVFNNKSKMNSIMRVWNNRELYKDGFYKCKSLDEKINYLTALPHVGKITANHLARNLGENVVKYDIWIQRLGVLYSGNSALSIKINNGKLDAEIKQVCDDMFEHLEHETKLPKGYIDVVLWKSAQNHLIEGL